MAEPMLDILKALAHGVGDMTYGDPDDVDAVKAADVVRWAAAEIARLRDERPEVVPPVMWKLTNYLQVMTWQPFFDDVVSRRDGEWIRAIAASGGKVKEVPRD